MAEAVLERESVETLSTLPDRSRGSVFLIRAASYEALRSTPDINFGQFTPEVIVKVKPLASFIMDAAAPGEGTAYFDYRLVNPAATWQTPPPDHHFSPVPVHRDDEPKF